MHTLPTAQLAALPELELRRWIARTEPRVADQCALLVALTQLGGEGAALAPFLARVEALSGDAGCKPSVALYWWCTRLVAHVVCSTLTRFM